MLQLNSQAIASLDASQKDDSRLKPGFALVVDDNSDNISIISHVLECHRIEHTCLQNGNEAIDILKSVQPNLIFLDLLLPDANGFDLIPIIQQKIYTPCPIIGMTAWVTADVIIRLQESDFSDYLLKPFSLDALNGLVDRYLGQTTLLL